VTLPEENVISDRNHFSQHAPETQATLVNPASGIANDYLNLFNEIVMLIEQLPTMPEFIEDIQAWHPVSYQDYFAYSPLPERNQALAHYAELDAEFRNKFETIVAELDSKAVGSVAAIRHCFKSNADVNQTMLADLCLKAGENLRKTLTRATSLVNYGTRRARETAQHRADRLLNSNIRKAG
jgi:hypothetical protein